MTISGLNFIGVLVAFVVSFISGAIWFGPKTFYPVWMKARGVESGELTQNQNKPALLFGGTAIALVIQIVTLASSSPRSKSFSLILGFSTEQVWALP